MIRMHISEPTPCKEAFSEGCKYHHKLLPEQMAYANREATVKGVVFYHGSDPVYVLDCIPGLWLEPCLRAA